MKEYELYVPLHYNDGRPVEHEKLASLKRRLVQRFGGLTHFPQSNEGLWKIGSITFRDQVVILRVLASETGKAEDYFRQLKESLRDEWEQKDFLIVAREVSTL